MEKGKIYKITNKKNKQMYIGCTVYSLEKRFYEHLYRCFKSNYKSKLYNSIKKYGEENFEIELIVECDLDNMYDFEKNYIKEYDTYYNGLNSTLGGEGCLGYEHSDEIRQNISNNLKNGDSHKGKTYEELYGANSDYEKEKRRLSVKLGWENMSEDDRNNRIIRAKEMSRKKSKYGVDLIIDIKNKFREGVSVKEVKKIYPEICVSYLYAIKNNKRWSDI
jgi:group I intron endonuclease